MNHNKAIFWASFATLIAAGVGFAIRGGGILGEWEAQFGFTKAELGTITGGGLVGFGITIIICSFFVDNVGYKPLLLGAFLLHVMSAVVTLAATPIYAAMGRDATYWCLYVGMFMFALANGVCEAVINPLTATLFPKQKTHYLNILHAGWPGGLILGGILAFLFVGRDAALVRLRWEIPLALFLIPTLLYGAIVIREKFPLSEARAAGVSFGQMLKQFISPILLFLLLLHAMVGYVELGTDSWITDIMNNVITGKAVLLFIYTSAIMFVLRFFAGPIVERINPVGLLLASAVLGCLGLLWLSVAEAGLLVILAATTYGIGKTFLWPTMLGVVGERYPRGGALTMGTIGGVGMLSAGLLGGPMIGYKQDYYASQHLQETAPELYEQFISQAPYSQALNSYVPPAEMGPDGEWPERYGDVVMKVNPKSFLFFPPIAGLDGKKVAAVKDANSTGQDLTENQEQVLDAVLYGGRMALRWTALVPALMALGYLFLVIYFWTRGGYKVEVLHAHPEPEGEEWTGGVEAPIR